MEPDITDVVMAQGSYIPANIRIDVGSIVRENVVCDIYINLINA